MPVLHHRSGPSQLRLPHGRAPRDTIVVRWHDTIVVRWSGRAGGARRTARHHFRSSCLVNHSPRRSCGDIGCPALLDRRPITLVLGLRRRGSHVAAIATTLLAASELSHPPSRRFTSVARPSPSAHDAWATDAAAWKASSQAFSPLWRRAFTGGSLLAGFSLRPRASARAPTRRSPARREGFPRVQ
jgi:hypothetical protein